MNIPQMNLSPEEEAMLEEWCADGKPKREEVGPWYDFLFWSVPIGLVWGAIAWLIVWW